MYVSADMRPSIAAQMLGLDMPTGDKGGEPIKYSALDEVFDKAIKAGDKPVAPINNPGQPIQDRPEAGASFGGGGGKEFTTISGFPLELDAQQIKDLDLWRQVASRNYAKGKGAAVDFKCESVPAYITDPIRARLTLAQNELEVLKAFDVYATQSDRVMGKLERALDMVVDDKS